MKMNGEKHPHKIYGLTNKRKGQKTIEYGVFRN